MNVLKVYIIKWSFFGCILFGATNGSAQIWRDSLNAARKAYTNKEYKKALEYYKSAQKNAPEGVDLSQEMAQSAYKEMDYSTSEKLYKQQANSTKNATDKAKGYHNLGNSYMQQKKYQDAIDAYKESLRVDPKNDKTRHNLTEAMRMKKEQQEQQQKQQQQQNNQQQNQNQQNQNNQQSSKGQQQNTSSGNSKLKDKAVEKKLDELMKNDSKTKRMMGGENNSSSSKSGKDW